MARKHVLAQQRSRSLAPVVFIVAHPDDEIIGAGGTLLPACPNSTIIHVTDGAPCNLSDAKAAGFTTSRDYSDARRREAAAALSLAGIGDNTNRRARSYRSASNA